MPRQKESVYHYSLWLCSFAQTGWATILDGLANLISMSSLSAVDIHRAREQQRNALLGQQQQPKCLLQNAMIALTRRSWLVKRSEPASYFSQFFAIWSSKRFKVAKHCIESCSDKSKMQFRFVN
jgi:hypothetical protein